MSDGVGQRNIETKAWLWRVTIRGVAIGFGLVVGSFLFGLWLLYRWHGLAGVHRGLEFRPSDISFDLMAGPILFAFGFATSPLYELCKRIDATIRARMTKGSDQATTK